MLARTYKNHRQLGILKDEYAALFRIKEMLERGEIKMLENYNVDYMKDEEPIKPDDKKKFNMSVGGGRLGGQTKKTCGTVGCIGGWVAYYMGGKTAEDMNGYVGDGHADALHDLYYPHCYEGDWNNITIEQAVEAIENFLTTGKSGWRKILGLKDADVT